MMAGPEIATKPVTAAANSAGDRPQQRQWNCSHSAIDLLAEIQRNCQNVTITFDTILDLGVHTSTQVLETLECRHCSSDWSSIVMLSMVVEKLVGLYETAQSAYGIAGGGAEVGMQSTRSGEPIVCLTCAVSLGTFKIEGEDEKLLVQELLSLRLRDSGVMLARLKAAVQELSRGHEGRQNNMMVTCAAAIAHTMERLAIVVGQVRSDSADAGDRQQNVNRLLVGACETDGGKDPHSMT